MVFELAGKCSVAAFELVPVAHIAVGLLVAGRDKPEPAVVLWQIAIGRAAIWTVSPDPPPPPVHDAVVAPPFPSVQSVRPDEPATVPAVRILVSVPCKAMLEVTVLAVAATGICPAVMPDKPPPPPATHVHTAGSAAVQERNVFDPDGCTAGS